MGFSIVAYVLQFMALLFKSCLVFLRSWKLSLAHLLTPVAFVIIYGNILKHGNFELSTEIPNPPILGSLGFEGSPIEKCYTEERGERCIAIAYAPTNVPGVQEVMERLAAKNSLTHKLFTESNYPGNPGAAALDDVDVLGFETEDELQVYLRRTDSIGRFQSAVMFNPDGLVNTFNATAFIEKAFEGTGNSATQMHLNPTPEEIYEDNKGKQTVIAFRILSNNAEEPESDGSSNLKLNLQVQVTESIMAVYTNQDDATLKVNYKDVPFTTRDYNQIDGFTSPRVFVVPTEERSGIIFYSIGSIFSFMLTIRHIMQEKESKILDSLRSMGLSESGYWLSWFVFYAIITVLSTSASIGVGMMMNIPLFERVDTDVLFTLFFTFNMGMVSFAMFITSIMPTSGAANNVAAMAFILPIIMICIFVAQSTWVDMAQLFDPFQYPGLGIVLTFIPQIAFFQIELDMNSLIRDIEGTPNREIRYSAADMDGGAYQFKRLIFVEDNDFVKALQTTKETCYDELEQDKCIEFSACCLESKSSLSFPYDNGAEEFIVNERVVDENIGIACTENWNLLKGETREICEATGGSFISKPRDNIVLFYGPGRVLAELAEQEIAIEYTSGDIVILKELPPSVEYMFKRLVKVDGECRCLYNTPSDADILSRMMYSIFAYLLLSWYFGQVLTFDHGRPKSPLFIVNPWYWLNGFIPTPGCMNLCWANASPSSRPLVDDDVMVEGIRIRKAMNTPNADPIVINKLVKDFGMLEKFRAVDGVTVGIRNGECFALLGHNGAGKSTLLNQILGLTSVSGGDCTVNGVSVVNDIASVRKMVSTCPQHDILWDYLTASEHLWFYGLFQGMSIGAIQTRSQYILDKVKLQAVDGAFVGSFSGGMKRRLSVAISVLGDRKVVFLDEPTTGMDPQNRRHVWDLINELKKDRAVILTTHAMEEADSLGDRIGIMKKGRLVALGTSLHLKNKFGTNYRIDAITKLPDYTTEFVEEVSVVAPGTDISIEPTGVVRIEIRKELHEVISSLFRFMESKTKEGVLRNWGFTQSSLEDVFLKLNNSDEHELALSYGNIDVEKEHVLPNEVPGEINVLVEPEQLRTPNEDLKRMSVGEGGDQAMAHEDLMQKIEAERAFRKQLLSDRAREDLILKVKEEKAFQEKLKSDRAKALKNTMKAGKPSRQKLKSDRTGKPVTGNVRTGNSATQNRKPTRIGEQSKHSKNVVLSTASYVKEDDDVEADDALRFRYPTEVTARGQLRALFRKSLTLFFRQKAPMCTLLLFSVLTIAGTLYFGGDKLEGEDYDYTAPPSIGQLLEQKEECGQCAISRARALRGCLGSSLRNGGSGIWNCLYYSDNMFATDDGIGKGMKLDEELERTWRMFGEKVLNDFNIDFATVDEEYPGFFDLEFNLLLLDDICYMQCDKDWAWRSTRDLSLAWYKDMGEPQDTIQKDKVMANRVFIGIDANEGVSQDALERTIGGNCRNPNTKPWLEGLSTFTSQPYIDRPFESLLTCSGDRGITGRPDMFCATVLSEYPMPEFEEAVEVRRRLELENGGFLANYPVKFVSHKYSNGTGNHEAPDDEIFHDILTQPRLCPHDFYKSFQGLNLDTGDLGKELNRYMYQTMQDMKTLQGPFENINDADMGRLEAYRLARKLVDSNVIGAAVLFHDAVIQKGLPPKLDMTIQIPIVSPADSRRDGLRLRPPDSFLEVRTPFYPERSSYVSNIGHLLAGMSTAVLRELHKNGAASAGSPISIDSANVKVHVGHGGLPKKREFKRQLSSDDEDGTFYTLFPFVVTVGITLVAILPLPFLVFSVVQEKELKLRSLMTMMGLKPSLYWVIQYLFSTVLVSGPCFVIFCTGLIAGLANVKLAISLFLWANNMAALALLLSVFFQRTNNAQVILYALTFAALAACIVLSSFVFVMNGQKGVSWSLVGPFAATKLDPSIEAFLFPPYAFFHSVLKIEQDMFFTVGTDLEQLTKLTEGVFLWAQLFLVLDWIITLSLGFYLDEVLPKEYGVSRHVMFPLEAVLKRCGIRWPTCMCFFIPDYNASSEFEKGLMDPDIMDEYNAVKEGIGKDNVAIQIEGLRKVFKGRRGVKVAVENLHLRINKRTCFGLLGPNGAGKSTTISILTGLYGPTAGTAIVNNYDITQDMHQIHETIGVCPQFDVCWPSLNVLEHLLFFVRLRGIPKECEMEAATNAARAVKLHDALRTLSKDLSGGMRRRLSLAIALIGDPDVVFLDEPTTGVDPDTRRHIWNLIERIKQTRSVVLTTHSMEEAEVLCDRVGIMAHGSLKALGDIDHVKGKYASQFKLSVTTTPGCEDTAKKFVSSIASSATAVDQFSNTSVFTIDMNINSMSSVFEGMQAESSLYGIEDWGMHQASLDDAFVEIAAEAEREFGYA